MTESLGLREQPHGGAGDVETELGWRPLPQVPAGFHGGVEDARVALAGFWRNHEAAALEGRPDPSDREECRAVGLRD
jgi:hypothetical protein